MADQTDWFTQSGVAAALEDSAVEVPEEESAPESDTVSASSEPVTDAIETEPVADAESVTEADALPPVAETFAPPPEQQPVSPNWDSPDNPHYQSTQRLQAAQTIMQRLQEQQAAKLANEEVQKLADDDPQRVKEIETFIDKVTAPLKREVASAGAEVELASKLATVLDSTMRDFLDEQKLAQISAEVERRLAIPGGPDALARDIEYRRADRGRTKAEMDKLSAENADLRKKLEARETIAQRTENGADRVDSNTGLSTAIGTKYEAVKDFDEFFDVLREDIRVPA